MALKPSTTAKVTKHSRFSDWSTLKFDHSPVVSETLSPEAQKEKIEELLSAVNSSSQHVRNFYITLLLVSIYIAIIIWSTTDVMLLKETPVTLPLLNAELPISGFYAFAPYFYLLLHFNLLLQLSLLADKLRRFDAAVSGLQDPKAQSDNYARLFPFAFTHALSGRQHSGFLIFLLTVMVWITIILLPLGLLIGLQIGFLPYHSEQVLFFQRWAIVFDLLLLSVFWPMIRSPDSKWHTWIMRGYGLTALFSRITRRQINPANLSWLMMIENIFSLMTPLAVISFSWGVAVLPDSNNEKQVAQWISAIAGKDWLSVQPSGQDHHHYLWFTEWLFDRTYLRDTSGEIQKDGEGQST